MKEFLTFWLRNIHKDKAVGTIFRSRSVVAPVGARNPLDRSRPILDRGSDRSQWCCWIHAANCALRSGGISHVRWHMCQLFSMLVIVHLHESKTTLPRVDLRHAYILQAVQLNDSSLQVRILHLVELLSCMSSKVSHTQPMREQTTLKTYAAYSYHSQWDKYSMFIDILLWLKLYIVSLESKEGRQKALL